jgi:hypothetical protein
VKRILVLAALAVATPALAADTPRSSPRLGSFEVMLGGYRPAIDAEFAGGNGPYRAAFGDGRGLLLRADVAKALFTGYGSLELGVGAGYFEKYGRGRLANGTATADTTAFKVIPTRLSLTYRFDILAERFRVPLAPYGRASFERYNWWVNNGAGNTADAGGLSGSGATNGYSFSGGLAFLLDFFDPTLARDMDRDTGINHTYVYVDFTKSFVSDFHSTKSWNLSDDKVTVSGGLLFAF